jgi:alpha-glucuronidase
MDRSVATGTGFAGQYWPGVAKVYENAATTPDNLLTFFHHVPYTFKLHSGQTVIQYIYDSHYRGADEAAELGREWSTLKGRIDPALFDDVARRLEYQSGHAIVWRDAVVQYFLKLSGIADEKDRAGHYPNRLEAEDARLTGYKVFDVNPWEDASRGKTVTCMPSSGDSRQGMRSVTPSGTQTSSGALDPAGVTTCAAEWTYTGAPGRFDIAVQYFDLQGGDAKFMLIVNGQPRAGWIANVQFPSRRPTGDNSARFIAHAIDLKPGDAIRVEGTPDRTDPAALDYIEVMPPAP